MNRKKTILICTDWYEPGYKAGGPIRSVANLVAAISNEFEMKVLTRSTDLNDTVSYPNITVDRWTKGNYGEQVLYLSPKNLTRSTILTLLKDTDFDLIYLNSMYSYYFTQIPLFIARKVPIFLATRGMLSQEALNIKSVKKKVYLKILKWLGIGTRVHFHATNNAEATDIEKQFGDAVTIITIPNLPSTFKDISKRKVKKKEGVARFIHIGRISPEKNQLTTLKLLKSLQHGEVYCAIVGPEDDIDYAKKCKDLAHNLPHHITVEFIGGLPHEKVGEMLMESDFLLFPALGENYAHVVPEALQRGVPVIISDRTPWHKEQINNAGWVIDLEDEKKFSEVLNEAIAMNTDKWNQLSDNASKIGVSLTDTESAKEAYIQYFNSRI